MEDKNLFYEGSKKFYFGHPYLRTYMCQGQRGRGKTTYWVAESAERAIDDIVKNPNNVSSKFTFIRRTEEQCKRVIQKGLFNSVLKVPKYRAMLRGWENERIWQNFILLGDEDGHEINVGYMGDLNNVKGVSQEDSDCMIFDEYVEPERRLYKGGDGGINEPELLARFDETINRLRDNYMILLGNFDSPTNPYNEYFEIPFGVNSYTDKSRCLYYEVDYSEDTKEMKLETATGKRWSNTKYSEYSNGNVSLGSISDDMIVDKPTYATHSYNFNICGQQITCWKDETNGMYFFHDNYKFDKQKPIYTVMSQDMKVNSLFMGYSNDVLIMFKTRYAMGRIRFNNQKTASLFKTMINLTK